MPGKPAQGADSSRGGRPRPVYTAQLWPVLCLRVKPMDSLLKNVILQLVEEGIFGKVKFSGLEADHDSEVGAQFGSTLAFYKLTVDRPSTHVFPLVVKIPFSDPDKREARSSDAMFHNEVTMYKEILPALGVSPQSFPIMFYGNATAGGNSENDILILENLKCWGFQLSKQRIFLDYDHVYLAIKRLAEFHSLSYIHKQKRGKAFLLMTKKLKDVILPKSVQERLQVIHFATIERGIKPLLENQQNVDILKQCLRILENPYKVKTILSYPEEPFAVICHGDFCNNNVFYKYDESGKPIACSFFDFQLAQYASPAIDLFFFLYMHTTSDFRENHWEDILKLYWNTLKSSIPEDVVIPCFEDYLKHFGSRALYGYIICSWFLPVIMDHNPVTKEDYMGLCLEDKIIRFTSLAGEEGGHVITDVVLHLLSKGYLKEFIEMCKEKNRFEMNSLNI